MAVMPIPFILLLLLLSLLLWRYRALAKRAVVSATLILGLLSSQLSVDWLARPLEASFPINSRPISGACYVMVLGSAHADIAAASAVQSLSAVALARLSEGIRQLALGQDCQLLVSGWSGELTAFAHAQMMAKAAVELGVDSQRIVQLPLARDTVEEALYAKEIIGDRPLRLVTSADHMPRAMAIFTTHGLAASPAPTDFRARPDFWWRLNADNLLTSQRAIHEYIGRLWFWMTQE